MKQSLDCPNHVRRTKSSIKKRIIVRRTATKLYSGSKKLRSTCSGNIRPIRRTLPLIGREQSSHVDEEEIKIKMDDGVSRFFSRFGGTMFIC